MPWMDAGRSASEHGGPAARRASRPISRPGSRVGASLLALCLLCAVPALPATDPAPPVVSLELRSDAPQERPEQLLRLVTVELGRPLAAEDVRSSILNLHARGVAGEIEVLTRPAAGGVVVIFVLWGSVQVEEVRLEGDLGIKLQRLRGRVEQRAAEPLVEDRVIRSLYRLQDLYREQGYFQASVRVDVAVDEARKQAVVTYPIQAGPRAQIGSVELGGEGTQVLDRAAILKELRLDPGDHYGKQALEADADRLQRWLVRSGWRRAEVGPARETVSDDEKTVDLVYPVEMGPRVEVEVLGASLAELAKKDLLPILVEEGYDPSLLLQTEQRLRRYYQSEGHYRVLVDAREEPADDGALRLVVEIEPGPVYTLRGLTFEGNERIATARLENLVSTNPRKTLVPGSGRLVDEVLAADLDNLRSFYALEGFVASSVGPARVTEEGADLFVTVPVEEGPRRRVVDVEIEGAKLLSREELLSGLSLEPGGPFHPQRLQASLDRIRSRYEALGYDTTQVSAEEDWNDEHTLVDITFHVLEGPQARVERVVVRGYRKTRIESLLGWIDLEPGDPVSTRRLLEVQRDLYRRGIFSRVEVGTSSATRYAPARSIVVRVEEGRTQRLFYGLGYDSDDGARGLVGYSRSNLFGRGYSDQFDLRVSQRESQARALLLQPSLGRFDIPVTYSVFRLQKNDVSFDSERQGGQVELRKPFGPSSLSLRFLYKQIVLSNVDPGLEEIEIDRDLRSVTIASIGPSLFVDRRDDPVDPTSGWSLQLQTEYAFPFLAARTELAKVFTQQTAYLNLGRPGVLAGSLRFGAIEPLGANAVDPTIPEGLPSAQVPISERFFAGGRTSHRAYRRDRLGIPGQSIVDGANVGGDGLVLANLELRFPVTDTIGLTAFADAGNIWADWRAIDLTEIKTGVGIGGRYLSPIGPLRLEIGWKLDREPGEDPFVVFLSFGNPF